MAKPIEDTPVLYGEDAEAVLRELRAPIDRARAQEDARRLETYKFSRNGSHVTIQLRDSRNK